MINIGYLRKNIEYIIMAYTMIIIPLKWIQRVIDVDALLYVAFYCVLGVVFVALAVWYLFDGPFKGWAKWVTVYLLAVTLYNLYLIFV